MRCSFLRRWWGYTRHYLWRLEHLGRNWNLIMSAPVRPLYLFAAKALALIKLVAFTQGWVFLLFLLCGRLWARLPGWPPAQIFLWLLRGVAGQFADRGAGAGAGDGRSAALPCRCCWGWRAACPDMLIASKGGTRAGLFWPVFADADGHERQQSGRMCWAAARPFSGPPALCGTAVFFAAAALWLRARDVEA